jgi:hypothetical protein
MLCRTEMSCEVRTSPEIIWIRPADWEQIQRWGRFLVRGQSLRVLLQARVYPRGTVHCGGLPIWLVITIRGSLFE